MIETIAASSLHPPDYQKNLFRIISRDDYPRFGIDPQDVPIGTFAAEDHPNFLASRSGGNAYGLGLIEQYKLNKADFEFIQKLDFQDRREIAANAKRINQIHQRLGLLIRFSNTGKRYFLIPINLVAHSLQDVTTKADEIEQLVLRHTLETGIERLDIGLMASSHDLLVHELRARLSIHRLFLFESTDKIRSWRTRLDLVILPRNPAEYLLEQPFQTPRKRTSKQKRLFEYGAYMTGKIYDILEPRGQFVVLAHTTMPRSNDNYEIDFQHDSELKRFLVFTHIFRTHQKYDSSRRPVTVHAQDLFSYLNRFASVEPQLQRLLKGRKSEDLSLEELDRLPYLNLRLPSQSIRNPGKQWQKVFETYFETIELSRKCPKHQRDYWQQRLILNQPFPKNLILYTGRPRSPQIKLEQMEQEVRQSGLMGCTLPLVAEYRNTFRYVLDVLYTLARIRDKKFTQASEIESDRLRNPFRTSRGRYDGFNTISRLVRQISKLRNTVQLLNPDHIEGIDTPVLENLAKLSLHGYPPAQLRELLLIVVGHSTMSRVVFGKLPANSLRIITDRADAGNSDDLIETLRFCRLMSIAESAAALGDLFTREHSRELFELYRDAVQVASNPAMDWDKLRDFRISELGGVQNKAVREMMKFFNLFEFLNNWKEFEQKGRFETEVFCDYDPARLAHLQEAMNLVATSKRFKADFIGDHISSQSYFFRQFLETEFHGTGHLFPGLATSAGFILLWIAVNAAEKRVINFNPMLARFPSSRQVQRIEKIRAALLSVPKPMLKPSFFESIRKTLADGRPAFILDSGVRLISNTDTKAVDVSFVDVDENIVQIDALLSHFESQKLHDIPLKQLQDLGRLFSELESFRYYLQHHDDADFSILGTQPQVQAEKDRKIGRIEARLKAILQSQVFIPEEIYDTISMLAAHCPEVLRFILPEFHAFGNLVENWPTRKKQSLGTYVMRSLEKFQALITKDRDAFQDRNIFYQLAKHEFGALAEEDLGAKHTQLETLEHMVDRIQQTPVLYRAFTMALLFQDIGKVERDSRLPKSADEYFTHAQEGASVLTQTAILAKYDLDQSIQNLALALIRRHGIIGHVIQGEEPITELEVISRDHDARLADAFVLHSILAAAAVEEGLMTEDLLDLFLLFRREALRIIKCKSNWRSWLRDALLEKGQAILADAQTMPEELHVFSMGGNTRHTHTALPDGTVESLARGREIASFERLLRLMEVRWVDYPDLQMYLMEIPVNFIYHKKVLKSVGVGQFSSQLEQATKILQHLMALNEHNRNELFRFLDPYDGGFRIYDFHPLNRFLEVAECVKMLLIACHAFSHLCPQCSKGGLISFRPISQGIDRRFGALRNLLRETHLTDDGRSGSQAITAHKHWGGLHFQVHPESNALRVGFQDALQLDHMVRSLDSIWNSDAIDHHYQGLLQELRKLPYETFDYEEQLKQAYDHQCHEINNRTLRRIQKQLKKCCTFKELKAIRRTIESAIGNGNLVEEQEFLLREIFDYHRERLLNLYLEGIQKKISHFKSKTALIAYWNQLKFEMLSHRDLVGKEYESLIARLVDETLITEDLAAGQAPTAGSSLRGKIK